MERSIVIQVLVHLQTFTDSNLRHDIYLRRQVQLAWRNLVQLPSFHDQSDLATLDEYPHQGAPTNSLNDQAKSPMRLERSSQSHSDFPPHDSIGSSGSPPLSSNQHGPPSNSRYSGHTQNAVPLCNNKRSQPALVTKPSKKLRRLIEPERPQNLQIPNVSHKDERRTCWKSIYDLCIAQADDYPNTYDFQRDSSHNEQAVRSLALDNKPLRDFIVQDTPLIDPGRIKLLEFCAFMSWLEDTGIKKVADKFSVSVEDLQKCCGVFNQLNEIAKETTLPNLARNYGFIDLAYTVLSRIKRLNKTSKATFYQHCRGHTRLMQVSRSLTPGHNASRKIYSTLVHMDPEEQHKVLKVQILKAIAYIDVMDVLPSVLSDDVIKTNAHSTTDASNTIDSSNLSVEPVDPINTVVSKSTELVDATPSTVTMTQQYRGFEYDMNKDIIDRQYTDFGYDMRNSHVNCQYREFEYDMNNNNPNFTQSFATNPGYNTSFDQHIVTFDMMNYLQQEGPRNVERNVAPTTTY